MTRSTPSAGNRLSRRVASSFRWQRTERGGLDYTYLSKIENDRLEHTPSVRTLRNLAAALEVDELGLMELADKVPPVLEGIARDKDAMLFFRWATETVKSPEGWRDLLAYLEHRQQPHSEEGEGCERSKCAIAGVQHSFTDSRSCIEWERPRLEALWQDLDPDQ
jgi:transcriptional regulator with XRE-family HTH domain